MLNTTQTNAKNKVRSWCGLCIPPLLEVRILRRTPGRLREDVVQEAWLAHLSRKNPNTVARNYIRRRLRLENACPSVSQLEIEIQQEFHHLCY